MASRAFAAIASLLLFMITFLLLGYGLISSGAALWATALVLLVVNIVIVFITWTNIRRFYRYASRPFQIQQRFEVRLSDDEEILGQIVVEGPAMLILKTSGPLAIFTLCYFLPPCAPSTYPHGSTEVDFLVHYRGRWSALLTARRSGPNMAKNALSAIAIQVRGHCRVHQLPEGLHAQAKGFPVVMPSSDDTPPHHL